MPIYEYKCPSCGVFEVMQGISEDPLAKCPTCKSKKVRKLISETSFQLKGSGWYATDYGKGKTCSNTTSKSAGNGDGNGNGNGDSKAKADGDSKKESCSKTSEKTAKPAASSTSAD